MKSFKGALVGAVLALFAPMTFAQTSVGFGVSSVGGDGIDFRGATIDGSGRFSDNLGWSVGSQIGGSDEGVDLDYFMSAKLRAGVAVGEGFLFLNAGYGRVKISGFGESFSDGDFLYGVGFETFFADSQWGLGLEFNTGSGDLDEADELKATVRYKF
jgi:hypothetical protein